MLGRRWREERCLESGILLLKNDTGFFLVHLDGLKPFAARKLIDYITSLDLSSFSLVKVDDA
jgi:hypothetical protein